MKNNHYLRTAFLLVVVLCAAALVPRVAGSVLSGGASPAPVREINLVARDMTFYLEGQNTPNPTLHARPGERIRLVLRNGDPGMTHDFTIQSWSVATRQLKGKGQDSVEFTVPDTRGTHAYSCTPHSAMMGGIVEVR
jgi:plastocyanin